jgi:membrane-bound metal-dependent hydrolase YbcI (DUF457 family)
LFLLLIPFIAAFNYVLTYTDPQLDAFLALTYTIDTLTGYLAVYGIRRMVPFPDQRQLAKRIVVKLQAVLG